MDEGGPESPARHGVAGVQRAVEIRLHQPQHQILGDRVRRGDGGDDAHPVMFGISDDGHRDLFDREPPNIMGLDPRHLIADRVDQAVQAIDGHVVFRGERGRCEQQQSGGDQSTHRSSLQRHGVQNVACRSDLG